MIFPWTKIKTTSIDKDIEYKAREEARRLREREEFDKRELERQEYERRESDRRVYERGEYERREQNRRKREEEKYSEELADKMLLETTAHENKLIELAETRKLEQERYQHEISQVQKIVDFNSICAGKNVTLRSHEGKVIIDAEFIDTTSIKFGEHVVQGSVIELEAGDGIVINTIHPNKLKITLDAYKFLGGMMDRLSKLETFDSAALETRVLKLEKGE